MSLRKYSKPMIMSSTLARSFCRKGSRVALNMTNLFSWTASSPCRQKKLSTVIERSFLGQHYSAKARTRWSSVQPRVTAVKSSNQSLQSHQAVVQSFNTDNTMRHYVTVEDMTAEEKATKFNRPKAQTTIDEEEVSKFSDLSALWWDEGGEFEALHSLNDLRIPLVRDALVAQKPLNKYHPARPLEGFWILDVGSGGGILSEPLARLGAHVVGLEASDDNIKIAQAHLIHDPEIRERVKYIQATVEDTVETQAGKFDAVVASEVLEHVADANTFVSACCKLVRPGGSVFFTTLNKTNLSYVLGVVVAERLLKLVSPGTHDWEKFISPMDLEYMLEQNNCSTRLVHGMFYNPASKRWSWSSDTSINYAVHAIKPLNAQGEEDDVWTNDTTGT